MNTSIHKAAQAIAAADAIFIGASNGLSIAEGYNIFADNDMFKEQFGDLRQKYGIRSVLDGCFLNYPDDAGRHEFMSRLVQLWVKEYKPSQVMKSLIDITGGKDCFIITTNGDTHLELAGFSADRVFELEGTFEDVLLMRQPKDRSRQLDAFIRRNADRRIAVIEMGTGKRNRMIKFPLTHVATNCRQATFITFNMPGDIYIPPALEQRSVAVEGDIAETLSMLNEAIKAG